MDGLNDVLSKLTHFDLSGQIEDIQPTASGLGASCDVFTGHWRAGRKKVAVKKLRIFLSKEDQVVQKLAREVYIWSKLDHKNVLPLLGFFLEGGEFPHLVSEWMEKGTLRDYIPFLNGDSVVVSMIMGIAEGLSYLHEKSVIHADLKSLNILISGSGEPLLADFGLSHVLAASMTKMCGTTMGSAKGTARWMAIELLSLSDELGVVATPNEKSDVWAFGMTIYEILKRDIPYGQYKSDHQVVLAISRGKLPDRPSRSEKSSLSLSERKLWDICGNCWKRKPETRPSMLDIVSAIASIQEGTLRPTKRQKMDISKVRPPSVAAAFRRSVVPIWKAFLNESDEKAGANVPTELKKEGEDWIAVFNPNVKRRLDVSLAHVLLHESVVCCVRFSVDGKSLATGGNKSVQIFDTQTGVKVCILADDSEQALHRDLYIRSLCFSPDGKYLATGAEDELIRVWDIAARRVSRVFEGHQQEINSLNFSPDGRLIVSGSGDCSVRIWDMETGAQKVVEILEPDAGVTSVAISPDTRLVAAGSYDSIVRIWDVETRRLIDRLQGHNDSVYSIAFTPDGKGLVSGSLDNTLKYWDISLLSAQGATSESLATDVGETENTSSQSVGKKESTNRRSLCTRSFTGHQDYILTSVVSHDGPWLFSGSKDRCVRLWDRESAEVHFVLQGHRNSVLSVDATRRMFATGSGDWQARIWKYTAL